MSVKRSEGSNICLCFQDNVTTGLLVKTGLRTEREEGMNSETAGPESLVRQKHFPCRERGPKKKKKNEILMAHELYRFPSLCNIC